MLNKYRGRCRECGEWAAPGQAYLIISGDGYDLVCVYCRDHGGPPDHPDPPDYKWDYAIAKAKGES